VKFQTKKWRVTFSRFWTMKMTAARLDERGDRPPPSRPRSLLLHWILLNHDDSSATGCISGRSVRRHLGPVPTFSHPAGRALITHTGFVSRFAVVATWLGAAANKAGPETVKPGTGLGHLVRPWDSNQNLRIKRVNRSLSGASGDH